VLNPIRVFRSSFGGETLYQNPDYQSPNEVEIHCINVLFNYHTLCVYIVSRTKMDLEFSLNNSDKFKRNFTIFGTHYFEGTFYKKHVKICFGNLLVAM